MGRTTEIPGGALKRLIKIGKGEDPCWEWLARVNPLGYPVKRWIGMDITGARWVYLLLFGPIRERHVLKNRCGNRLCVNPSHAKLVPMREAQRDGEGVTLLQSDVDAMRLQLAAPGAVMRKERKRMIERLAGEIGVTYITIRNAMANRTWHDPKLPRGIDNIIKHFKENPPPCASTSSSSSSPMVDATSSRNAPTTPSSRPRSRRPRVALVPPATRYSPSQLKSASPSNGER